MTSVDDPLLAFRSSPESSSGAVALGLSLEQLPPLRFPSPSASSRWRTATCSRGHHPRDTCLLGVSHALKAFLRPPPAGLISCRSRPWGFSPEGSFTPAEPWALSSLGALLWLLRPSPLSRPLNVQAHLGHRAAQSSRLCETALSELTPLQGLHPCLRPHCLSGG